MLYSVDFVVHLRGKFALHEELVVQNFKSKKIGQSSTMCVLALFSYPCVRNSYVHFVLLYFYNQHMFYIQLVIMNFWHGIFVMTYSAPLISS